MGDKIQEEALRAGYGPTVQAESVKKLVDSVVNFQIRSREIIEEMRLLRDEELRRDQPVRRGRKRRMARLAQGAQTAAAQQG